AVTVLPIASLDALGIGALLAILQRREGGSHDPTARARTLATAVGGTGIIGFFGGHLLADAVEAGGWLKTVGEAMVAPAALGVVYPAVRGIQGPVGRMFAWGPLVSLGKISYGLYLFHFFVP